jgi:tetratricopeptide (TPR) repeat protein
VRGDLAERAREIFLDAVDLPLREQRALLEERCGGDADLRGEVESLLDHHDVAAGRMPAAMARAVSPTAETAEPDVRAASGVAKRIGRYEIRRVVASGGMGTVYEAVQDSPHRLVALKVLRHGAASPHAMKRFRHEAEILGQLRHPSIAHIHDAGTSDDGEGAQPYFAMELVKGEPLTRYAEVRQLGTRQRLELLAKVCDAVQYAHHKGVIHRDLKPDNILVDQRGEPKILDFGIARATGSDIQATTLHTDVGQLIGTVPYMSPEQVTGDPDELDTRSDVYSLGVVLYELMSGRLPHELTDKNIPEAISIIREEEPRSLSSVNRTFRGDIETIVARALEKDKERRYQTAADLALDIRRYLADEPIVARPASTFYQLRKFARRNRVLVGGVAAGLLLLVAGTIVSTVFALGQARQARIAREINEFLTNDMISAVDPSRIAKEDLTVYTMLDEASRKIGDRFEEEPLVESAIRLAIGRSYLRLGRLDSAETHLRAALHLRRRSLGEEHLQTLDVKHWMSSLERQRGRFEDSAALLEEVIAGRRREVGIDDATTLRAMAELAWVFMLLARFDDAEPLLIDTLRRQRRTRGEEHPDTLRTMNSLGGLYVRRGQYEQADPLRVKTLEIRRRVLGEMHPETVQSMQNLGVLRGRQGRNEEAEALASSVLDLYTRLYGDVHPSTLHALSNLILRKSLGGDYEACERLAAKLVERRRRVLGDEHLDTLMARNMLAWYVVMSDSIRAAEAEQIARETCAAYEAVLGPDNADTLNARDTLGLILMEQGRFVEAEALYRDVLTAADHASVGRIPVRILSPIVQSHLGRCLVELERYREAEPLLAESIPHLRRFGGLDDHLDAAAKSLEKLYDSWSGPQNEAAPGDAGG